jgi:CRISPR/Cas system CSM-associated protein Csm3 (group 7 of RAMP superfamily)
MIHTYRPFQLIVEGRLVLKSPVHVGTGEVWSVFTDAPVLREANQPHAAPYLPGTSLKGVLRSHLEHEAELIGCNQHHLDCLFGRIGTQKADHSETVLARLTVFDALLQSERTLAEVRDHVRLSRKTGVAQHGAKFDAEVVLPDQAEFRFCAIYEGNSDQDEELVLVRAGIQALERGELRVGAKSGWGYGRIQLQDTTYREYQRTKLDDLRRYLNDRLPGAAQPGGSSERRWPELNASSKGELKLRHDPLCELSFGLRLQFEGPVLVKAPIPPLPPLAEAAHARNGAERNHPQGYWKHGLFMADDVFIAARAPGEAKPYLPGSSLRGVLRARVANLCFSSRTRKVGRALVWRSQ